MDEFIAHVRQESGVWKTHPLADHLRETARMTGAFAGRFGAEGIGYIAGL